MVLLVVLLAMWRANGKWIPVNTRNAIDANAGYINYVRCQWMFYHSSKADEVAQLRALCPTLNHFVCLDQPCGEDHFDGFDNRFAFFNRIHNGAAHRLDDGRLRDHQSVFDFFGGQAQRRRWLTFADV